MLQKTQNMHTMLSTTMYCLNLLSLNLCIYIQSDTAKQSNPYMWKYVNYIYLNKVLYQEPVKPASALTVCFVFLSPSLLFSFSLQQTQNSEYICSEVTQKQAPWMLKKMLIMTTLAMERKGKRNVVFVHVSEL